MSTGVRRPHALNMRSIYTKVKPIILSVTDALVLQHVKPICIKRSDNLEDSTRRAQVLTVENTSNRLQGTAYPAFAVSVFLTYDRPRLSMKQTTNPGVVKLINSPFEFTVFRLLYWVRRRVHWTYRVHQRPIKRVIWH